jgi:hypothetical protein
MQERNVDKVIIEAIKSLYNKKKLRILKQKCAKKKLYIDLLAIN